MLRRWRVGLLAWVLGMVAGLPVSAMADTAYQCLSGASGAVHWHDERGWTPAPDGRVPVRDRGQVCWVRLSAQPAKVASRLAFSDLHIQRVDILLQDAAGQPLAEARRVGPGSSSLVTGRRALFLLPPAAGQTWYARLQPTAGSLEFPGVDRHVLVQWVDSATVARQEQWTDLVNMGAVLFLATTAVVALFFLFSLKDPDYGIFAMYAAAQALTHFSKSGLGFALDSGQWWWVNASMLQYLVSALSAWLYLRFGRFREHSPLLARLAVGVGWGFVALVPLQVLVPAWTEVLVFLLLPLHFTVALGGNWRGWRRGVRTSGILLLGLVPIAVYWAVFLAHVVWLHQPVPGDLAFGSTFDMVRTVVLPAVFCWGLADRTLRALHETRRLLTHDALTGLLNREGLRVQGQALIDAGHSPLVAVVNIERFHSINEVLGNALGDQLLQETGQRLSRVGAELGPWRLARMHADQFCLVFESWHEPDGLRRALQAAFVEAAEVDGQSVDLSIVTGLAPWGPGVDMAHLIRNAEVALDAARAQHKSWQVYAGTLEQHRSADLGLLSELRRAVLQDELRMYLQPKIRLSDGSLSGAEALVRWEHPVRGMVPPGDFVPFAEKTGRLADLTQWMLQQAMRETARWRARGRPLKISVNLSIQDLSDPGLPERLLRQASVIGAHTDDLCLEITESAAMHDAATSMAVMDGLKRAGFSLSIDDFGTGYSSLAYLQKMPVTELKVDRAFVRDVHLHPDGQALLESIVVMGHRLGLEVVAEGAETISEWQLLARLRCDQAQGWFAAKPMPAEALEAWAAQHLPFQPEAVASG